MKKTTEFHQAPAVQNIKQKTILNLFEAGLLLLLDPGSDVEKGNLI